MEILDNNLIENSSPVLRDNSKRASIIIYVFWAICLVNILAIGSNYLQLGLFERFKAGMDYTDAEIEVNDLRQGIIGTITMIVYIASIVFFLMWFRRAYGNLHNLGIRLQNAPSMSVWSFFIPIVSLVLPYQIAKETYTKTHIKIRGLQPDYSPDISFGFLGWWWALFILNNFISNMTFRLFLKEDTIEDFILSTQVSMGASLMDILAAILTIYMIKKVSEKESVLYRIVQGGN